MELKSDNRKKTYAISGLTSIQLDVILAIVYTANRRCFPTQEDNGKWYSNNDFVLLLTDEQRQALAKVGNEITRIYNN